VGSFRGLNRMPTKPNREDVAELSICPAKAEASRRREALLELAGIKHLKPAQIDSQGLAAASTPTLPTPPDRKYSRCGSTGATHMTNAQEKRVNRKDMVRDCAQAFDFTGAG
jgi:hypothetical protein